METFETATMQTEQGEILASEPQSEQPVSSHLVDRSIEALIATGNEPHADPCGIAAIEAPEASHAYVDVYLEWGPEPSDAVIHQLAQPDTPHATATVALDEGEADIAKCTALEAQRSARGARAHYLGETIGRYVCRVIGAQPAKLHSNNCALEESIFKIRTINGSQNTFTVNLDTEPECIIVAARKRDRVLQGASRYVLYGVRREDAFARARKSSSRGHVKSGHQQVSLAQVRKIELGQLVIPNELVQAETSDQRNNLLGRIDTIEYNLEDPAARAARAFLTEEPV